VGGARAGRPNRLRGGTVPRTVHACFGPAGMEQDPLRWGGRGQAVLPGRRTRASSGVSRPLASDGEEPVREPPTPRPAGDGVSRLGQRPAPGFPGHDRPLRGESGAIKGGAALTSPTGTAPDAGPPRRGCLCGRVRFGSPESRRDRPLSAAPRGVRCSPESGRNHGGGGGSRLFTPRLWWPCGDLRTPPARPGHPGPLRCPVRPLTGRVDHHVHVRTGAALDGRQDDARDRVAAALDAPPGAHRRTCSAAPAFIRRSWSSRRRS
jgi:hypothetical protein